MAEVQTMPKSTPPIINRKRPIRSAPQQPIQSRRKTRDLPNISNCHCCGLRFPDKGRNESLEALRSQWRVVFICSACLHNIQSAKVCSYCFSPFGTAAESVGSIDCTKCRSRVHLSCVPTQRGYVVPFDLDPCYFTCVDCSALPKYFSTKPDVRRRNEAESVDLEGMVVDANSVVAEKAEALLRAKEKAFEKAMAAKHATELAKSALDFALLMSNKCSKVGESSSVLDRELARRLHKAINGSQRITRNCFSPGSNSPIDVKYESGGGHESKGAKVCVENKCLEHLDSSRDSELLSKENGSGDQCDLDFDSSSGTSSSGTSETSQCNRESINEGQASCSEAGDNASVGSLSASSQRLNGSCGDQGFLKGRDGCQGDGFAVKQENEACNGCQGDGFAVKQENETCNGCQGDGFAVKQENETCDKSDRYLKKYYCRRNFKMRKNVNDEGRVDSGPLLKPHMPTNQSNAPYS